MQKKRQLIIVLLLIIPSVYAVYEEVAVSGWVNATGSLITNDNRTFNIVLTPGNTRIIAYLPTGDSLTVKNGSCEIINFYDICFIEAAFDYHNYEEDRDYYKAKVSIYDIIANLELTRTIDKTDLLINEEASINIELKNTGEREATDIKFTDRFPSQFVISDISGCQLSGEEIIWKGTLKKLWNKKCSYTIKPTAKIDYESEANISYFNGKETKQVYSESESLNIPDYQLNAIVNLSKYKANLNDKVDLNVKIKNNHTDYPITVGNFYIEIPLGLEISNVPVVFQREYNKFKWQGTLEPAKEKTSYIELKVKEAKYYKIKIHAEYIINDVRKSFDKFLTLNDHMLKIEEHIPEAPPEEDIASDLNETISTTNETAESTDEGTELTNEATSVEVSENITNTLSGTEKEEERKAVVSEEERKETIIKKIYANIFNNPAFIVIDAIIISLIIIMIINLKKGKEKESKGEQLRKEKKEEAKKGRKRGRT